MDYCAQVYVWKADDVPSTWLASCVLFGVMTWGDSPGDAFSMIHEAVDIAIDDMIEAGKDPYSRGTMFDRLDTDPPTEGTYTTRMRWQK